MLPRERWTASVARRDDELDDDGDIAPARATASSTLRTTMAGAAATQLSLSSKALSHLSPSLRTACAHSLSPSLHPCIRLATSSC
jgi:hypothetical protein